MKQIFSLVILFTLSNTISVNATTAASKDLNITVIPGGGGIGFYVATNGNDSNGGTLAAPFATLGRCQTAMRNSGIKTCYLRAGTYTLPSTGLVLTNVDNNETWSYYSPDGLNTAILSGTLLAVNTSSINNFNSPASGITITGLKFTGNSYIVAALEGNNLTFTHNVIDGGNTNPWYGIDLQGSGNLVADNTIQNLNGSGAYGIWSAATNSIIESNTIQCNSHFGMFFFSSSSNIAVVNNQILGIGYTGFNGSGNPPCSTFVSGQGTGVDNRGSGILFVGNTITHSQGYTIVVNGSASANYISDNTLQADGDPAITLNGGPSTVIRRNTINSPGGNGMNLGDEHDFCPRSSTSNNLLVTNNTINSAYEPIYLSATQNSQIFGNIGNIGTITTGNPSPTYPSGISVINWAADAGCSVVENNTGNVIGENSFTSLNANAKYGVLFETNQYPNTAQYNILYPFGSPGTAAIQNNSGGSLTLAGNQTTSSTVPLNGAPPISNAGPSRTVLGGTSVTLDGSGTANMVGSNSITYAWSQILGSTVTINNPSSSIANFTAPSAPTVTLLGFQLTATTINGSTSDQVYVAVGPF